MHLLHPATTTTTTTTATTASTTLAYGCRYRAHALKRFLTFTLFHRHYYYQPPHRLRLVSIRTVLPQPLITLSLCRRRFQNPSFLTGNCLFYRMEVVLYGVVWTFYFILPIISGAERTYINDSFTLRPYTCPMALEGQTLPIAAPCVEAKQLNERFWSGNSLNKNRAMVEHLQHYGVISSKKVAEVMEAVDRALFVPDGNPPYHDSPMSIGYNATISAPHMHATCLQLLEEKLQPGMHALDVGSGTGYLTACFALMVGPQGHAVGVEHIPELVSSSIQNIEKSAAASLLKEGSLQVHVGDGRLGWPELAPYDAIHVGAAAPEIPQPLIDQLKPGGRMVIPVGNIFQDLKVVDKNLDGSVSVMSETSVRYVPLTSRDAQLGNY